MTREDEVKELLTLRDSLAAAEAERDAAREEKSRIRAELAHTDESHTRAEAGAAAMREAATELLRQLAKIGTGFDDLLAAQDMRTALASDAGVGLLKKLAYAESQWNHRLRERDEAFFERDRLRAEVETLRGDLELEEERHKATKRGSVSLEEQNRQLNRLLNEAIEDDKQRIRECDALAARLEKCRAVLRVCEWSNADDDCSQLCPLCRGFRFGKGHLRTCALAAALADAPKPEPAPECPGPNCPMCKGEMCNKCGAGCWDNQARDCKHDSVERHEDPPAPVAPPPERVCCYCGGDARGGEYIHAELHRNGLQHPLCRVCVSEEFPTLEQIRAKLARDREEQRRSFAHGNCNLANPAVSREVVDRAAEEMEAEQAAPQTPTAPSVATTNNFHGGQVMVAASYDQEGDVLYLSVDAPRPAISEEVSCGLLLRRDPKTRALVGVTILDFLTRFAKQEPNPLQISAARLSAPPAATGREAELAGELERVRGALEEIAEDWWPPTGGEGLCLECGRWTPARHPEAHDHNDGCKARAEYQRRANKRALARAALAPSPLAARHSAVVEAATRLAERMVALDLLLATHGASSPEADCARALASRVGREVVLAVRALDADAGKGGAR